VVVKDLKHIPIMDENINKLFKTPKQKYTEGLVNHLLIKEEDLTDIEKEIIDYSFSVLKERLEDIKLLNDEVVRLNIELANLKSYNDDKDY
jgi:uncharacterized metal-binding protein YceD (DUF177 family)